jgi:predicted transcriptional regulator
METFKIETTGTVPSFLLIQVSHFEGKRVCISDLNRLQDILESFEKSRVWSIKFYEQPDYLFVVPKFNQREWSIKIYFNA